MTPFNVVTLILNRSYNILLCKLQKNNKKDIY